MLPSGQQAMDADGKPKEQEILDAGQAWIHLRGDSNPVAADIAILHICCRPGGSGDIVGLDRMRRGYPELRAALTPKLRADNRPGQWNRFIITLRGIDLAVELNGKQVIEKVQLRSLRARGRIGLEAQGDPIQFGNIYVRE
jgi:hypothetical protein